MECSTPETGNARLARRDGVLRIEALMVMILAVVGTTVTFQVVRQTAGPIKVHAVKFPPLIEAESIPIVLKSGVFAVGPQSTANFELGNWSGEAQLFLQTQGPNSWIDMPILGAGAGPHLITVYLTRASDYGIVQFKVNGVALGLPIDLWAKDKVLPTGPIDLGIADLKGKADLLRMEVIGHNPSNAPPHFFAGIDGFVVGALAR